LRELTSQKSRNGSKRTEAAIKLLEQLKTDAESGIPILVEGLRDKKALKELGVSGNLVQLQVTKSLDAIAEELARGRHRRVIILTDPDSEGGKIAARIASLLEQYGTHPDLRYRKIARLAGKTAVEQLRSFE